MSCKTRKATDLAEMNQKMGKLQNSLRRENTIDLWYNIAMQNRADSMESKTTHGNVLRRVDSFLKMDVAAIRCNKKLVFVQGVI